MLLNVCNHVQMKQSPRYRRLTSFIYELMEKAGESPSHRLTVTEACERWW